MPVRFIQDKETVYRAFHVEDVDSLQDVLHCMVLSEAVYKAYEGGPAAVPPALAALQRSFHPSLCALETVQCSLSHVHHRYIVSSSAEALYVAFMGTKVLRDYLADANYLQAALWPGVQAPAGQGTDMAVSPVGSAHPAQEPAAAHQGFLARSQRVPVELLYIRARQQGKRLVLCGHSLGGAVAKLCTLRLLHQLDSREAAQGHIKCVAFAAPALGNAALATLVNQQAWSHAFYNLTLPEDIVPRLLAMRYAASLPAAAADAVSQPRPAAQEDTASADMPVSASEDKGVARSSWDSTSATAAGSPSRSRWHTSLSSSMDKLRALTSGTAQSRPAADPSDGSAQHDIAEPVQGEQHAAAQEQPAPQQQQGQQGGALRSYVPSWGPARYLPTYVPFGGQHHLYAPATAPAATPLLSRAVRSGETFEAEDAEALAALESQKDSVPGPRAPAGPEEHQRASSYLSSKGSREPPEVQAASRPGTPPGLPPGAAQVEAEMTDGARRYALPLTTYHRMYTMRERAAAICSAAWSMDEHRSRPAVRLCQDLAPLMLMTGANAQMPVLQPLPVQPSASYRRWTPTALWAGTTGGLVKRLPTALEDDRAAEGTKGRSWAPAGLLASTHRVLALGQGALDQLRSSAQQAWVPQQQGEQEQQDDGTPPAAADDGSKAASATGSWWLPWRMAPAHHALSAAQAPSTSKARPWLPSGASRWMGSSAQDDAVRLHITMSGQGLAGCTSARLQTADGSFHEARIISAPAVSLTPFTELQQAWTPQQPGKPRLPVLWRRLLIAGRHTWQRVQSRGAPIAQPASDSTMEQLLLEVKLKHADAQAVVSSSSQHQNSHSRAVSTLKLHLRSDFQVVRSEVMLRRRQVWVLGSSSHTVERVLQLLGAAAAKHAFLPGVKTAATEAITYTCLVPANRDLATVAQLASQHIRRVEPPVDHGQANGEVAEVAHGDRSLPPAAPTVISSRLSHPLSRMTGMLFPAFRAEAIEAAKVVSTALGSTLQHARLSASQTAKAARAQLQRLRHRHTVLAMQQQSMPNLIMLCIPGRSLVMGDRLTKRQLAPAASPSFLKVQSPAAHSIVEAAAVISLVEDAHRAGIPALVILLTEDKDLEIHRSECAKAFQLADTDRLVILGGKPSSSEAFNLKRAIFDCLERSQQSPTSVSKL